jgi:hypothetical protein
VVLRDYPTKTLVVKLYGFTSESVLPTAANPNRSRDARSPTGATLGNRSCRCHALPIQDCALWNTYRNTVKPRLASK